MGYNAMTEAEIRQAISACAQESFLSLGIADTQMSQIAKQVGISRSTLYLYFPSKSHLVLHVADRMMLELRALAAEHERRMRPADGLAAIRLRLEYYLEYFTAHKEVISFLDKFDAIYSDEYPRSDESRVYTAHMADGSRDFYALVARGQKDGSVRGDIPANTLGSLLLNGLFGILQRMLTRRAIIEQEQRVHAQEVTERFLQLMLGAAGLGK